MHRETIALATIDRENTLRLLEQILQIATSGADSASKQKLVRMLEEVSTPGLKEKRQAEDAALNAELLAFTKRTFKVESRGGQLVGTMSPKPKL